MHGKKAKRHRSSTTAGSPFPPTAPPRKSPRHPIAEQNAAHPAAAIERCRERRKEERRRKEKAMAREKERAMEEEKEGRTKGTPAGMPNSLCFKTVKEILLSAPVSKIVRFFSHFRISSPFFTYFFAISQIKHTFAAD